jgi:hypothetical protein
MPKIKETGFLDKNLGFLRHTLTRNPVSRPCECVRVWIWGNSAAMRERSIGTFAVRGHTDKERQSQSICITRQSLVMSQFLLLT